MGFLDRKNKPRKSYTFKRCPGCFIHLSLDATLCPSCGQKVRGVDRNGLARKATDWKAYLLCVVAWSVLGLYSWWAFFR